MDPVVVRIARREILAHRRAWFLSLLLIATAVAALTVLSVLIRTAQVDDQERQRRVLGSASWRLDVTPQRDRLPATPASTRDSTSFREGLAVIGADGRAERVRVSDIPLSNDLAAGIVLLAEGRAPNAREVALSQPVLTALGRQVGDQVSFEGGALRNVTISGVVVSPYQTDEFLAVLGADARDAVAAGATLKYTKLGRTEDIDKAIRELSVAAGTTDPTITVSTPRTVARDTTDFTTAQRSAVLTVVGLAMALFSTFVASAFAMAMRRQRRYLGLLSASGGTPGQLRASLLTQGGLVGASGALFGVAAGLLLARAGTPVFVALSNQAFVGLVVRWVEVGTAAVVGVIAALLAASAPAYLVGRQSVNDLLRAGLAARKPYTGSPLLSLLALVTGVTILSVQAAATVKSTPVLIFGAAALLCAFGLLAPYILYAVQDIDSLPWEARFASRDAGRNLVRVGPAAVVVASTVTCAVALTVFYATREDVERESYVSAYRSDEVEVIETAGGPQPTLSSLPQAVLTQLGVVTSGRLRLAGTLGEGESPLSSNVFIDARDGSRLPVAVGDGDTGLLLQGEEAEAALTAGKVVAFSNSGIDEEGRLPLVITDRDGATRRITLDATLIVREGQIGAAAAVIPSGVAVEAGILSRDAGLRLRTAAPQRPGQVQAAASVLLNDAPTLTLEGAQPYRPSGSRWEIVGLLWLSVAVPVTGIGTALVAGLVATEGRADAQLLRLLGATSGATRRVRVLQSVVVTSVAVAIGLAVAYMVQLATWYPVGIVLPWQLAPALGTLPLMAAAVAAWFSGRADGRAMRPVPSGGGAALPATATS